VYSSSGIERNVVYNKTYSGDFNVTVKTLLEGQSTPIYGYVMTANCVHAIYPCL